MTNHKKIKLLINKYSLKFESTINLSYLKNLNLIFIDNNIASIYDSVDNITYYYDLNENKNIDIVENIRPKNPDNLSRNFHYILQKIEDNTFIIKSDTKEKIFKGESINNIFSFENFFIFCFQDNKKKWFLAIIDVNKNQIIKQIPLDICDDTCILQGFDNNTVWLTTVNHIIKVNLFSGIEFKLNFKQFNFLQNCHFDGRGIYKNNKLYLLDHVGKQIVIFNC